MGASLGGTDIIALLLIKWKKNISVGKVNIITNAVLYGICLFLFDVSTVIYSLIYAAVSAFAVDHEHSQNINVEVRIITKLDDKGLEQEILQKMDSLAKEEPERVCREPKDTLMGIAGMLSGECKFAWGTPLDEGGQDGT